MGLLERLRDERTAAADRMTAIIQAAEQHTDDEGNEGRDLTAEEREEFDGLEARRAELDEDIKRAEAAENARTSLDESRGTIAGRQAAGSASGQRSRPVQSETRDSRGYPNKFTGQTGPMICTRRFQAGDQELASRVVGLHRAMVDGNVGEARALSEGTPSEGGYLVPEEFSQDIVEKLGQMTPLANREFMRIIPMSRDVMNVPVLDTRPTVSRIAENSTGDTGTDPAWDNVQLTARKYGRVLPMSEEFLEDEHVGVVEFLRDLYAEILAENRNDLILNGDGSSTEPDGVLQNNDVATVAADTTDGGTIHDSVVDTYNAVIPRAREGGIWITSTQGWGLLAKAKDDDNRPLIQQLAGEAFARLLGHPLFVTDAVPSDGGDGSDETELVFGNFRRGYVFGDRSQVAVKLNDGGKYFENFQLAIRVSERWDGAVGQPQYFVRGTGWAEQTES